MQAEPSSTRIELIDGIKGLAILAVIYTHTFGLLMNAHTVEAFTVGGLSLSPMTIPNNSSFAVTVFLILSGFLLARPYAKGEKQMNGAADVLSFYRKRAMRLLPVYYFALILALAVAAPDTHPSESLRHLLLFGTLTFQWTDWYFLFPPSQAPSYIPFWFMSLLFWGSVLFPLLLLLIRKIGIRPAVLIVLLFSVLARFLFLLKFSILDGWHADMLSNIFCRIDDCMLGIGLAFLRSDSSKPAHKSMLLLAGLALVLSGFILIDNVTLGNLPRIVMSMTYVMIGIGFTILIDVLLAAPVWLKSVIEFWPLRLLGRMSYSLYLIHGLAIAALIPTLNIFRFGRYMGLVLLLSWFSYRYIENGSVKNWRELLPKTGKRAKMITVTVS